MIAQRNDGKREKFLRLVKIPFKYEFDPEDLAQMKKGLIPKVKDDKWFIYFKGKTLYFHRSRTGQGAYQVRLKIHNNGSATVKWAKCSKDIIVIDKLYDGAILEFLIANLLLGYDLPFPVHVKLDDEGPGVFQHVIAGTGYPEKPVDKKMLKRRLK